MLQASGLSESTIEARGYYTETEAEGLKSLGFNRNQSHLVPALVIPVRNVHRELVLHRIRPDEPRIHENGKPGKYESPAGAANVIDVPPPVAARLCDDLQALWFVEGEKKADSIAELGEVAVALLGVWAWKRDRVPLPDLDRIPIAGRDIRIAFDSDTAANPHVRRALVALAAYVAARGGQLLFGWMPPGPQGEKQGVDDLIARGATIEDFEHYLRPYRGQKVGPEGWPELSEHAFYGLAGQIVNKILPHTEADPAALLFSFLIYYGAMIGRGAHFKVEGDTHYLKDFAVLVGKTAKGRKGVSEGRIMEVFHEANPGFMRQNTASGLSSGEGLIDHVRDERTKVNRDGEREILDEGIIDKRLLVTESEFASPLTLMSREGNILSMVLRNAWDDRILRTLTKNNPTKATGCHIAILGHTTMRELRRHLTEEKLGAGIGNRFMFALVHRSKALPQGGRPDPVPSRLIAELKTAVSFGQVPRDIDLSHEEDPALGTSALRLWEEVYEELSEGEEGLFGSVTSRAEVHVRKVATLYAALDRSEVVNVDHLLAGLAVWDYAEASARYLFGDLRGDPLSDEILALVRMKEGVTRGEIVDHFSRHVPATKLGAAIGDLLEAGLIREEKERGGGPGRPPTRYYSV